MCSRGFAENFDKKETEKVLISSNNKDIFIDLQTSVQMIRVEIGWFGEKEKKKGGGE